VVIVVPIKARNVLLVLDEIVCDTYNLNKFIAVDLVTVILERDQESVGVASSSNESIQRVEIEAQLRRGEREELESLIDRPGPSILSDSASSRFECRSSPEVFANGLTSCSVFSAFCSVDNFEVTSSRRLCVHG
jgi:hypothetical protein